jgi:CubicO group peptidase (beta-lactamase class C family)
MDILVKGEVRHGFEPVRDEFIRLWQGIEVGASFCVFHRGEIVVDIWGGYTDRDMSRAWQQDTLVNVFSTTKGPVALAIAILVEEGKLDYAESVARYWPEFGARGKHSITVAQLLSHQAGLCGLPGPLTVEDLYDWDKMINLLAAQAPLWSPGAHAGYHAVTWGYLVGELVRRVSGTTLAEYLRVKIAEPLEADFYIGLPETEFHRCASLIGTNHARKNPVPASEATSTETSILQRMALQNPIIAPFKHACSEPWRLAEIAASNGHASARGIATIYAALSMGGTLGDATIISTRTLSAATKIEVDNEIDLVLGRQVRRGRGFIINTDNDYGPNARSFGHNGTGGSTGFADPDAAVGIGYVMNQMKSENPATSGSGKLIRAVYRCI